MRGVCFHWKLTTDLLFFIFLKKIKVDTHFLFFFFVLFFHFSMSRKKKKIEHRFSHFWKQKNKKTNWTYISFFIFVCLERIWKLKPIVNFCFPFFTLKKKRKLNTDSYFSTNDPNIHAFVMLLKSYLAEMSVYIFIFYFSHSDVFLGQFPICS